MCIEEFLGFDMQTAEFHNNILKVLVEIHSSVNCIATISYSYNHQYDLHATQKNP